MNKIEKAVAMILDLIEAGWEFPDALMKACSKFNVDSKKVIDVYDSL